MARRHIQALPLAIKIIGVLLLLGMVYLIYDILLLLFIAYIIQAAVYPAVTAAEKKGLPRWLGLLTIFSLVIILVSGFLAMTITPLIVQTRSFIQQLPVVIEQSLLELNLSDYIQEGSFQLYVQNIVSSLSSQLTSAPGNLFRFASDIFGGFLNVVLVFIFAFYFALEREQVSDFLVKFMPTSKKESFKDVLLQVDKKLGNWFRGQILLMLIIGFITYIGLALLQIPFALPLAVIAGFLEIIPIIGPIISAVPAILVALALSPLQALVVGVLYLIIQQLENSVIVPRVMRQAVGLDPLVVIIALTVGGRLAGPFGALLSVPAVAILMIVYNEWGLD